MSQWLQNLSADDWFLLTVTAGVLFYVAFMAVLFIATHGKPYQASLPIPCPRCNGGPQGDLDCWWCGGIGTASNRTRRGY